jgi:hypothetical protein
LIPKVDSAKVRPLPESVVGWFNWRRCVFINKTHCKPFEITVAVMIHLLQEVQQMIGGILKPERVKVSAKPLINLVFSHKWSHSSQARMSQLKHVCEL